MSGHRRGSDRLAHDSTRYQGLGRLPSFAPNSRDLLTLLSVAVSRSLPRGHCAGVVLSVAILATPSTQAPATTQTPLAGPDQSVAIDGFTPRSLKPRYTEYPGMGHAIWSKAFADPELVDWVFAQHR
jgi:hypothetical protein